jgi:hypothetical protein
MAEKRTAARHRVLKAAATIEFGGGAIDCMVRNLSDVGAALEISSPIGIPEHFALVLAADGLRMPCHVVWRKEKRIGVAFDQDPSFAGALLRPSSELLPNPRPDPNRPRTEECGVRQNSVVVHRSHSKIIPAMSGSRATCQRTGPGWRSIEIHDKRPASAE